MEDKIKKAVEWMSRYKENYRSSKGEINTDLLAQDCADALYLCTDDDGNIPEWLFDEASVIGLE